MTSSQQTSILPSTSGNHAVNAITNLWFSWAQFDLNHHPGTAVNPNLQTLLNDEQGKIFDIKTSPDNPRDKLAGAFSETVFDVMNDFSSDPNRNDPNSPLVPTSQLLQFIMGDNVADLPNMTNDQRQMITNQVIALMRGVPNTPGAVNTHADESLWFPTPGDPAAGGDAKYNLNPFVWFVQKYLKDQAAPVYAYAFSVDDEFGNILVPNSSTLEVTVGGPDGLTNKEVYVQPK